MPYKSRKTPSSIKNYIYVLMTDLGLYVGWLFCGIASEFYCGFVAQLR